MRVADISLDPIALRISGALKRWMDVVDLTVLDLHKRTGIARSTVDEIVRGKRVPSVDTLDRLATELGTTGGQILDGIGPDLGKAMKRYGESDLPARLATIEKRVAAFQMVSDRVGALDQAFHLLVNSEALPKIVRDRALKGLESEGSDQP